mmetsp:Transcript_46940/g.68619  ORF Transcript_46940/g.68619 Transcript_46940/m.68619 type:complete len:85 (-) Transcript_46940:200-454(-)
MTRDILLDNQPRRYSKRKMTRFSREILLLSLVGSTGTVHGKKQTLLLTSTPQQLVAALLLQTKNNKRKKANELHQMAQMLKLTC